MKMKEKDVLYKKLLKKYGDIISKYTIYDIVLKENNKCDIEKEICKIYIEELEYLKEV